MEPAAGGSGGRKGLVACIGGKVMPYGKLAGNRRAWKNAFFSYIIRVISPIKISNDFGPY
jgi:hypothetical protein